MDSNAVKLLENVEFIPWTPPVFVYTNRKLCIHISTEIVVWKGLLYHMQEADTVPH
jgi:hypothetical protein